MSTTQSSGAGRADAPPVAGAELDAFISYARDDLELRIDGVARIDRLLGDLVRAGKRVWLDRSDIEPAADWRERIARGITAAKALIFLITPRSIASEECLAELRSAGEHHKRVIPVVLEHVPEAQLPESLSRLNLIFARESDDYERALGQLIEALESDIAWRDAHSRLAVRTREWLAASEDLSFLLRGSDLKAAEDWYARKSGHREQPTDEQYRYILASRRAASRRQRTILAAVATALVIAVALAIIALIQRATAVREQHVAQASSLSARSSAALSSDFNAAALESLESYRIDPTPGARNAVVTALEQPTSAILRGHRGPVDSVAFSADGTIVASGGQDGTLRLWSVRARHELGRPLDLIGTVPGYVTANKRSSGEVTAVAFSPRGDLLAAAAAIFRFSPGGVALAAENATLTVWRLSGGTLAKLGTLADPGHSITHLAFSPDGRLLAIANDDGSVVLVATDTGRVIARPGPSTGTPSPSGLSFSPDGRELALLSGSSIRFWSLADGRPARPPLAVAASAVAFDPARAGVLALATGSSLALYDTRTGRALSSYDVSLTAAINDLAFSPDGASVAVAVNDETQPLLVDVGQRLALGPVQPLAGSSDRVAAIAFNPSGTQVATANEDGTVRIFTVPGLSGLAHQLPGSVFGSATGVGGQIVAAVNATNATVSSDAIRLWSLPSGPARALAWSTYASSVAVAPGGRELAVGGANGEVRLLSVSSGRPLGAAMDIAPKNDVVQMAFSPNGRLLAGAGAADAYVYEVATQRRFGSPLPSVRRTPAFASSNQTDSVAFSPDGSLLAVGDYAGQVRLWRLPGEQLSGPPLATGEGPVRDIAFDPRVDLLGVIAGGQVQLWSLARRRRIAILASDAGGFTGGVAFSPDGSTLAAIVGCQLRLWDPASRAEIGQPIDLHYVVALARGGQLGCDPNGSLAFAADGSLVVNLGSDGPIYVWAPALASTSERRFAAQLCAVIGNSNLTRAQFAVQLPGQPYSPTCGRG